MNKELKFNKENDLWYIDIPEWKGTKGELLMVAGADKLLDVLDTDNDNTVQVDVNTKSSKNSNITLSKIINCFGLYCHKNCIKHGSDVRIVPLEILQT